MLPLLETLLIAVLGGGLFQFLHIPLAWMLGPMTLLLLWNGWSKRRLKWPIRIRDSGLILLGYTMGLAFSLETAKQIVWQLPSMLVATLTTIGLSILIGLAVSRLTGMTTSTGIIGSIPGGLTQMVVLSEEVRGTDTTAVTFMQTIRLLSVVFIVPAVAIHGLSDSNLSNMSILPNQSANLEELPFVSAHTLLYAVIIAGATWLAVRLRFPTPYLLGPMLASAAIMIGGLHAPHLPPIWTLLAQLAVGAHMGLSMRPASLKNWRRLLPVTLAGSAVVIALSMGLGQLLNGWHSMSLLTGFLGTAPGGMAEMGVTATIVNADLSMVVAYQMFRILFILLIVPPLLGGWLKRSMKGVGNDGSKKTSTR